MGHLAANTTDPLKYGFAYVASEPRCILGKGKFFFFAFNNLTRFGVTWWKSMPVDKDWTFIRADPKNLLNNTKQNKTKIYQEEQER